MAVANSSVQRARREAVSSGSGSGSLVETTIAPHRRPATTIGTPTVERIPRRRTVAASLKEIQFSQSHQFCQRAAERSPRSTHGCRVEDPARRPGDPQIGHRVDDQAHTRIVGRIVSAIRDTARSPETCFPTRLFMPRRFRLPHPLRAGDPGRCRRDVRAACLCETPHRRARAPPRPSASSVFTPTFSEHCRMRTSMNGKHSFAPLPPPVLSSGEPCDRTTTCPSKRRIDDVADELSVAVLLLALSMPQRKPSD
jgi:hypothetical protein